MDENTDRPARPDFLRSAEEILGKLGEPDAPGRKSTPEPGPRKTERQESVLAIGYAVVNDKKEAVERPRIAISVNIATHGVGLKTSHALHIGDLLMLGIRFRGERVIYALGEVTHGRELRDGTFESGIKFLDIREKDYELLLKLLP